MALFERRGKKVDTTAAPRKKAWHEVFTTSGSGGNVSVNLKNPSQTYADTSFVYEIASNIASAGALLPLNIYTIDPETMVREKASQHPAYSLLRRPNTSTTRGQFIESTILDLSLHGNAYWVKGRLGNEVFELQRVRPEYMVPLTNNGELVGWLCRVSGVDQWTRPTDDIVHFRRSNPVDDFIGLSPIAAMRIEIGLGVSAQNANTDFMLNGAMLQGFLSVPEDITDEQFEVLQGEWKANKSKKFRTPILPKPTEFVPTNMNPADAQFIETAKVSRERLSAAYRYPLPELNVNSTPDILRRALYLDAVKPLTTIIEEGIEAFLMPEWDDEAFPQFQFREIVLGDFEVVAKSGQALSYSGQWTLNEIRRDLWDLPPIEGGDNLMLPNNMSQVDDDGNLVTNPNANTENDTTGGMGGNQGQGIGGTTGSGDGKDYNITIDMKGYPQDSFRLMEKQSEALNARIRGVLKREAQTVLRAAGAKGLNVSLPDIERLIRESDQEIADLIRDFSLSTATKSAKLAQKLIPASVDEAAIAALVEGRIPNAVSYLRLTDVPVVDLFKQTIAGGMDTRTLQNTLEDLYGAARSRAEGVARTEVAFSAQKASLQVFSNGGASQVEWVLGTGPCSTGSCTEKSGQTFSITEAPELPDHPNCTCAYAPVAP
jgi:HK97 family phage portal protein